MKWCGLACPLTTCLSAENEGRELHYEVALNGFLGLGERGEMWWSNERHVDVAMCPPHYQRECLTEFI